MVEPNEQQEKARDKVREVLKASGKDPDKLMPKGEPQTPETPIAGAVSSTDNPKTAEEIAKENQETESRAAEAQKVEDTKKAEEDKQLLDTKDEDLSDEQKAKKKEVVALQETQKQADKDSNVQKRIDELVGEMKSLKHKDSQSVQRVVELEAEVKKLQGTFDRDPGKEDAEIRKLETERLDKFSKEDEGKPREERRELSKAELEEWLVDDITAASEWLARRELRRDKDRTSDREQMGKNASDAELKAKVDLIVKRQAESKVRVDARHPELNVQSRVDELKKEGKNQTEIQAIIWAENPKAKLAAEIIKENPEKYWSAEDGPELVAKELEKRMNGKKSSDVDAEKEEREAAEEAERQRQANIDTGLNSTRAPITPSSQEKDPIYQKQFAIWKKAFPNETVAQVKARLDKRLNVRRESGVA